MHTDILDLYQETIVEAAEQPQHATPIPDPDIETQGLNASCGDQVSLQAKLSPDGQRVVQLSWQGQGCIMSRAAAEHLAVVIAESHPSVTTVLEYNIESVISWLGLGSLSPGRMKCVLLALNTLQQQLVRETSQTNKKSSEKGVL